MHRGPISDRLAAEEGIAARSAGEDRSPEWARFVHAFRTAGAPPAAPWSDMFAPLHRGTVDGLVVVGQIGQSLDGRVATLSGHSRYINGPDGLIHLHRLRALVDAVVVGVGTVLADDPQLTVRRVTGPQPARVVIDPRGRLPRAARMLAPDGVRRIVVTAAETSAPLPEGVDRLPLPAADGGIAPRAILAALAARGLRRVLIEGGADTVSRFLAAGCLDRLHVMVAPLILGAGRAGILLPPVERADQALRLPMRVFQIGEELLLDCDLSARRVAVGLANRSM